MLVRGEIIYVGHIFSYFWKYETNSSTRQKSLMTFFYRKTHTNTYNQIIWFRILTRPIANSKKMSQRKRPFLTRRLRKRIVYIAALLAEHKFNLCLSPSSRFNHDDTRPPWGRRGLKSRIRPPYPQRVVKGD